MANLLKNNSFRPFFFTQSLTAFNDNFYKSILILIAVVISPNEKQSGLLTTLASGILILPFFILSPLAGSISDRYEKTSIIRKIKLGEIAIVLLGIAALYSGSIPFMLLVLFLLGAQSAMFGPVKYSYLPESQKSGDLMQATGLVEMGTFVAILSGMFVGNMVLSADDIRNNQFFVSSIVFLVIAGLGYYYSTLIPKSKPGTTSVKITLNPFPEYGSLYRLCKQNKSIFYSILAISWFWFIGSSLIALLPNLIKFGVNGDKNIITLCLMLFTLSLALGSVLSDKLSHSHIEIGMVPLGSFGISLFCFDLYFIPYEVLSQQTWTITTILTSTNWHTWRLLFDVFGLGIFGAWFIVPLYALIQHRSPKDKCSRLIAANNIANALFMVVSAVTFALLFEYEVTTPTQMLLLAIANMIVSLYIFSLVPEFFLRFLAWILAKTTYRLTYTGREHIPQTGAAILLPNHLSYIDWLVLTAAFQRPVRFVMHHSFYNIRLIKPVLKLMGCIPIAQEKENPAAKAQAFEQIHAAIRAGDLICIFPEGNLTNDGQLQKFRSGFHQVVLDTNVAVIPVAMSGLWGSFFSRKGGRAIKKVPKPSRRKLKVDILPPVQPEDATPEHIERIVSNRLDELNRSWMAS